MWCPPTPFWMTENEFRSHFSPFHINTQLFFPQNGCRRPFWMTENYFRSHFSPFQINTQLLFFGDFVNFIEHFSPFQYATFIVGFCFHKMAAGGHFGWPKNHFRSHFRSIRNFDFVFIKWLPAAIFDDRKIAFDHISRHFRSICNLDFFLNKRPLGLTAPLSNNTLNMIHSQMNTKWHWFDLSMATFFS